MVEFFKSTRFFMKPTSIVCKAVRVKTPVKAPALYEFPALSSISSDELVNSNFGKDSYWIHKSKFGHWPVYKKVQNTKITTEVKRIQGDVNRFKKDLLATLPHIQPQHVVVNRTAGYANIKGDVVQEVMKVLDENHNV